jgi:cytochrome oxidase Cu insertion factor (SCO1/SenC/PrrC family)
MSARLIVAALTLAVCASAASAQQHQGESDTHAYVAPDPGSLGGTVSLRDAAGAPFTNDDLRGRWTMLYFGYARCRSACPIALPTLATAAEALNQRGVPARAVFVDVEAAPAPIHLRSEVVAHAQEPGHGAHAQAAARFDGVTLLTGNRAQIRQALTAFHVRTDHMPPRTALGETGHSINHTTAIYIIDPAGAVVGYVYHTITPAELEAYVVRRASGT